ncbi:MAG: hypothetical protein NC318_06540 [Blautia sp.]|nr:hypothetical protein [Lachnoclostridium sp.]MCM1211243.1 hypothetical protein [Blautia sp.]
MVISMKIEITRNRYMGIVAASILVVLLPVSALLWKYVDWMSGILVGSTAIIIAGIFLLVGVLLPVQYAMISSAGLQYYVGKNLIWSLNWEQIMEVHFYEEIDLRLEPANASKPKLEIITLSGGYTCLYHKKLLREMGRYVNTDAAQEEYQKKVKSDNIAMIITGIIIVIIIISVVLFHDW